MDPAPGRGNAGARRLSERLNIPVYDVQKVGYPQRMRDYDARRRIERNGPRARNSRTADSFGCRAGAIPRV